MRGTFMRRGYILLDEHSLMMTVMHPLTNETSHTSRGNDVNPQEVPLILHVHGKDINLKRRNAISLLILYGRKAKM